MNGITSFDGAERYLELKDITVSKAGTYKLVVTYANGESAGTHAYNNDVVERYAQVSVNGASRRRSFSRTPSHGNSSPHRPLMLN